MKVLRIHVGRVATCCLFFFLVLILTFFIHDSYLFLHPDTRAGKTVLPDSQIEVDSMHEEHERLDARAQSSDTKHKDHDAVYGIKIQEEQSSENLANAERRETRNLIPEEENGVDVRLSQTKKLNNMANLDENDALDAGQNSGNQGVVKREKKLYVYDWWEDFHSKIYKGENIPDDMLALTPPKFLPEYKNPCFYVKDPDKGDITLPGEVKVVMKCLPYFHLIGVCKSGTTDLWNRLMQHHQIVRNSGILGKETHWWSWRRFGYDIWKTNAPRRHFTWYIDHFDRPAHAFRKSPEIRGNRTYYPLITGEGSPTYFWDFTGWELIPQNQNKTAETAFITPHCIHHLQPHAKLLLLLRNPVDRMFSDYLFLDRFKSHHNISAQLFHEGVQKSIAMYQDCVNVHHSTAACLYNKTFHMHLPVRIIVGMYSVWLKEWLKVFPRQQILILRTEDYSVDLQGHLQKVFQFLELSPLAQDELDRIAARKRAYQRTASEKAVGNMLPATRQILTEFYAPYNKELAVLLGDDKYLWL